MRVPQPPEGEQEPLKGRKHTPEQVVRKLLEADRLLGEGERVAEVAKALPISEHTFSRWRNQSGGMKADDAKDLRRLRDENAWLKHMVADQARDPGKLLSPACSRPVARGGPARYRLYWKDPHASERIRRIPREFEQRRVERETRLELATSSLEG
jgi:putative transposase